MYEAITHSIRIRVQPLFVEEQSNPNQGVYVWAYHVEIENNGSETVRLLNRHWKITDALGRTQEVKGAGVVGEQPVLGPGERFEYTSGTPLQTPSGIMLGSYEMQTVTGQKFDVNIPAFSLDSPHDEYHVN